MFRLSGWYVCLNCCRAHMGWEWLPRGYTREHHTDPLGLDARRCPCCAATWIWARSWEYEVMLDDFCRSRLPKVPDRTTRYSTGFMPPTPAEDFKSRGH